MLVKKQSQELKRNRIIIDRYKYINFSSNDYLGISDDVKIKQAFSEGVQKYGLGSGASAVVSGYYKPHKILEEKFSEFLNRDAAVLFNSGYHANLGIMTALLKRNDIIISDKQCHASLLEGIFLSKAKHYRYLHQNSDHLEKRLKDISLHNCNKYIVTESVFSMSGNISSINKIIDLSKKYKTNLIIDDAHGIGILGKNGKGISEYFSCRKTDIYCLITPLGKSLGSMGAIVSGNKALIENLIQFSKSYLYTTASPPAIAFATIKALEILQKENWRREKLEYNIKYFLSQSRNYGLKLISEDITPIKSIIVTDIKKALAIQEKLKLYGFLVACIRPPTVPKNTTRLRISLNCYHKIKDIDELLNNLAELLI